MNMMRSAGKWWLCAGLLSLAVAAQAAWGLGLRPLHPAHLEATALRAARMARDKAQIARDRGALRRIAGRSGHDKQRRKLLADLRFRRDDIAALRHGAAPWSFPIIDFTPGKIGVVFPLQIVQVVGPHTARVRIQVPFMPATKHLSGMVHGTFFFVKFKGRSYYAALKTVALHGFDFSQARDGEYVSLKGLVVVAKPYRYRSVTGARSLTELRPVVVTHGNHRKKDTQR